MAAATHIVTSYNIKEANTTTHFAMNIEESHIIADRLFRLGDRDVFISEIKTRKYGKRV